MGGKEGTEGERKKELEKIEKKTYEFHNKTRHDKPRGQSSTSESNMTFNTII